MATYWFSAATRPATARLAVEESKTVRMTRIVRFVRIVVDDVEPVADSRVSLRRAGARRRSPGVMRL